MNELKMSDTNTEVTFERNGKNLMLYVRCKLDPDQPKTKHWIYGQEYKFNNHLVLSKTIYPGTYWHDLLTEYFFIDGAIKDDLPLTVLWRALCCKYTHGLTRVGYSLTTNKLTTPAFGKEFIHYLVSDCYKRHILGFSGFFDSPLYILPPENKTYLEEVEQNVYHLLYE